MRKNLVVVRGGGDIASGTIHRLSRCGFKVVVLEVKEPTVIRKTVAYANAVYVGESLIESIKAVKAYNIDEVNQLLRDGHIPVLVDEKGDMIQKLEPEIVIDAILAKKNLGTHIDMAPIVIGLGPGFEASKDVDAVIETNRGHNLGRVLLEGKPEENTGIPGNIAGYSWERVIRSPEAGIIKTEAKIGDLVEKDECIGYVNEEPVLAPLKGVLRGLIQEDIHVTKGFKIGDVDPRGNTEYCFTISDKARAVGGGVLEGILMLKNKKQETYLQ